VPLPIGISGNFTNPKINLNTGQAVKNLTQQLIIKQKEKAKDQLVGKGQKALTDLLGGSKTETEATNTNNEQPKKSTEETLKNTAKNILGGFLGKKKEKDTSKTGN